MKVPTQKISEAGQRLIEQGKETESGALGDREVKELAGYEFRVGSTALSVWEKITRFFQNYFLLKSSDSSLKAQIIRAEWETGKKVVLYVDQNEHSTSGRLEQVILSILMSDQGSRKQARVNKETYDQLLNTRTLFT